MDLFLTINELVFPPCRYLLGCINSGEVISWGVIVFADCLVSEDAVLSEKSDHYLHESDQVFADPMLLRECCS